ncbi:ATP-binding protein [Aerosakkonema sp. BLCC-F183]|uniref:hybrid sensor histidine kinase/response regulator n=1 Tax=Aerosakkonema sp. BLCC-F183 TaxID=3342834 RepID=UPI0035B86A15
MNLNLESENKGNILIVDDLLENLQLLSEALLQLGYTVRSVTSGRMALKTVKVKAPDAILLDIKMPEMDGYEVCKTLKADDKLRHIPINLDFLQEDVLKLLNSMRIGTDRIQEIVMSLRNFSRHDEAEFKRVDIHQGIDNTLMLLQNRLKATLEHPEIVLIKDYGQLPLIECYSGQLNQVFMNLLNNAIDSVSSQFIGNTPQIKINTQVLNSHRILIKISDNGWGIPEELQSKLFDPFFTTKQVGQGTGLGLFICHQIVVNKHGGNLYCHSALGKGAEFTVEIPINKTRS